MVHEDDYNDTTEASNITSLKSDSGAEPNLRESLCTESQCTRTTEIKDCKCCEVHPYVKRDASRTKTEQVQEKRTDPQTLLHQFETSVPCICYTHTIPYTLPVQYNQENPRKKGSLCGFKWKWPRRGKLEKDDKTYEVKIKPNQCPHYAKPFMCCEISEGIPKPTKTESQKLDKLEKHEKQEKTELKKVSSPKSKKSVREVSGNKEAVERIDIYYFDHGNSAYYRTTDSPPILVTEKCAEKTDHAATRFWAEIFGTIHIGTAFITAFILQLLRFILYSIVRPLTIGILQLFADYFLKPLLSMLFNALIQPFLILFYNIATSLKDLCEPLAQAMGFFLREIANVFAAIRLVDVRQCERSTVCT